MMFVAMPLKGTYDHAQVSQSVGQPVNLSVNWSVNLSVNCSVNQSIKLVNCGTYGADADVSLSRSVARDMFQSIYDVYGCLSDNKSGFKS
jgi:hypothetical protein